MVSGTRYRAIRKIAEGGSAEVYLAEQLGGAGFKRLVVLKRIRPELCADARHRETLLEEAQLAMGLHHSNLVEVLDVGEEGGRHFLVLELVDGWTLHHVMRRARDAGLPLPPALAVSIAAEICRGLAYAHERTEGDEPLGIVHRDVCPNNVLLSAHAEVKLIDFGIARARTRATRTAIGRTKGKPAWMSPEQARAENLDARSDLFSVGSVLFAMLTGEKPFAAASELDVISLVAKGKVDASPLSRAGVPRSLRAVVLKAMAKDRQDRFTSAQEMLRALEALAPAGRSELENFLRALSAKDGETGITGQVLPPARPEPVSRPIAPPRRGGNWVGVVAALALLTIVPLPREAEVPPPASATPPPPVEWSQWGTLDEPLPEPEPIQISARLAPRQQSRATVAVLLESEPPGAVIKVDERERGRTPATLRLKNGRVYELSFEAQGNVPVRQRLMLTPRAGQWPRVTLRDPAP